MTPEQAELLVKALTSPQSLTEAETTLMSMFPYAHAKELLDNLPLTRRIEESDLQDLNMIEREQNRLLQEIGFLELRKLELSKMYNQASLSKDDFMEFLGKKYALPVGRSWSVSPNDGVIHIDPAQTNEPR